MARKHLIYSYPFFDAQVVAASSFSAASKVDQLDNASIDLEWTSSTLNATVEVQAKNGDNADWRTLEFSNPITISGASGSHEIILLMMPFTDLRLHIIVAAGSGTITAVLTSKSVGA